MLTRRSFIQGVGAATVGAVASRIVFPDKKYREYGLADTKYRLVDNKYGPIDKEYGPVDLRFYFLTQEPLIQPVALFRYDYGGVFGMQILGERGSHDIVHVRFGLTAVMAAADEGGKSLNEPVGTWTKEGKREEYRADMMTRNGKFMMAVPGHHEAAVWINVEDVRRVF